MNPMESWAPNGREMLALVNLALAAGTAGATCRPSRRRLPARLAPPTDVLSRADAVRSAGRNIEIRSGLRSRRGCFGGVGSTKSETNPKLE
jgi:hypothetical protein